MRPRGSLRLRMTLACVALVVLVTAGVLLVSWDLLDRHLDRTLPAAYASSVSDELARQYLVAVLGAGFVALAVAWAGAGRLLSPVRAIANTARRITEEDLDDRVDLPGRAGDELHDLAETFDGMLDRVQGAVAAQRRFVANASHELRTPMTVIRTEAEVALDDPDASPRELRDALHAIVEAGERAEQLVDALLVLAASTEGVPRREPVDLAHVVGRALRSLDGHGLEVDLEPVTVLGDDVLLERLAANLVENALRHGLDPRVELRADGVDAVLVVENGGEPLDEQLVARLAEPFERGDRARGHSGAGLGLPIAAAIATAHGGRLELAPRPQGGLRAEVRLPASLPGDAAQTREPSGRDGADASGREQAAGDAAGRAVTAR
ncbi:ATP-binding protein [Paraconexibacter sp.]|uniref:HAMP domain-containing sensor histidine kinase n=1 Tax=Paraconexibacter sp. TaxID=2949640 RepID=UPI003564DE48